MRLWSVHPSLLDAKGLLACWRETLLAQKVLAGETRGYSEHPQLTRFKGQPDPLRAIGSYLSGLHNESRARGYNFDQSKILYRSMGEIALTIPVTTGQLEFELEHLRRKLEVRDPARLGNLPEVDRAQLHPLFSLVPGEIEAWEKDAQALRR